MVSNLYSRFMHLISERVFVIDLLVKFKLAIQLGSPMAYNRFGQYFYQCFITAIFFMPSLKENTERR